MLFKGVRCNRLYDVIYSVFAERKEEWDKEREVEWGLSERTSIKTYMLRPLPSPPLPVPEPSYKSHRKTNGHLAQWM